MNKYTELSDFEINKKVAISIGFSCYYGDGSYTNGLGSRAAIVKGKNHHGNFMLGEFDPCNNPAVAMPIIIENKIGLSPMYHSNKWTADCLDYDFMSVNKNPCRGAMEVFLMMKDAENNQ